MPHEAVTSIASGDGFGLTDRLASALAERKASKLKMRMAPSEAPFGSANEIENYRHFMVNNKPKSD